MSEWTIATLKEHYEALRESDLRALALQAAEYERRLEKLNGEHETLAQMKNVYVLREVYDRDMDRARSERLTGAAAIELAQNQAGLAASANRRSMLIAVIGLGTALVGWGITFFESGKHL